MFFLKAYCKMRWVNVASSNRSSFAQFTYQHPMLCKNLQPTIRRVSRWNLYLPYRKKLVQRKYCNILSFPLWTVLGSRCSSYPQKMHLLFLLTQSYQVGSPGTWKIMLFWLTAGEKLIEIFFRTSCYAFPYLATTHPLSP